MGVQLCLRHSEGHRLGVFEKRVLRIIFRLKRDEVKGGWRKLHSEELNDLYTLPSVIVKGMGWAGRVACMHRGKLGCI